MTERRGGRHRFLDVVGAVFTALLTFTAVPIVLLLVVGNPFSSGLGHGWSPAPRDALFALTLAAWVAWAACCAQLVRAVISYVRNGGPAALGSASILDRLAARIAVGVLALSSVGAPLAVSSGAGAAPISLHSPATVVAPDVLQRDMATLAAPTTHATRTTYATNTTHATHTTHVVRPGESLARIAETRLDDAADWTAIAQLNFGRDMGQGTRFVDPDQLRAGWRLLLPVGARRAHDPGSRSNSSTRRPGEARQPDRLPELVALGLGSLACAALARRARRRHRPPPFTGELDLRDPLSEEAIDTATLLQRFDGFRRWSRSRPRTACSAGRCGTPVPCLRSGRSVSRHRA